MRSTHKGGNIYVDRRASGAWHGHHIMYRVPVPVPAWAPVDYSCGYSGVTATRRTPPPPAGRMRAAIAHGDDVDRGPPRRFCMRRQIFSTGTCRSHADNVDLLRFLHSPITRFASPRHARTYGCMEGDYLFTCAWYGKKELHAHVLAGR